MGIVVVILVKNATGHISDRSNYRPISLAMIVAKDFDRVLNVWLGNYLRGHDAQFGFWEGPSKESAIGALKRTAFMHVSWT